MRLVYKMAAVGCTEDNSPMDSEDKAENASLMMTEICKKNGLNPCLATATVSDTKPAKCKKVVKINGGVRIAIAAPSIPSLRSRRDPLVPDLWKKTKKLTTAENKDGHFYEKLGKTVRAENVKNNTDNNSDSSSVSQHVSSKKTMAECCTKLQNGIIARNCTPTSNGSNWEVKSSVSVKTENGTVKTENSIQKVDKSAVKADNNGVKTEKINEKIKAENKMCKLENRINNKKVINGSLATPLLLGNGSECKVNTRVPCHNSNGIHFVFRLQSPTINNTSVSNLWRTNSSEFNTPDTSRSSTPQPLFGGCSLFSPGGEGCKGATEKVEEKPVLTDCNWTKCGVTLDPATLMEHIKQCHVETQTGNETFVCLWEKCKVYNKRSCSQSWLQRHILCHSGDKPFRCIVEGCHLRFPSQNALERHVNNHFNTLPPPSARSVRSRDDTPTKIHRKKRLKRKRPGQVKTGDFFDCRVMDYIRHDMVNITNKTQLDINSGSSNSVTFQSSVICRKTDKTGKAQVLLHYTPEDVLPDCWILESQVDEVAIRTIPLSDLPRDSAINLHQSLYRTHRFRKHRRK